MQPSTTPYPWKLQRDLPIISKPLSTPLFPDSKCSGPSKSFSQPSHSVSHHPPAKQRTASRDSTARFESPFLLAAGFPAAAPPGPSPQPSSPSPRRPTALLIHLCRGPPAAPPSISGRTTWRWLRRSSYRSPATPPLERRRRLTASRQAGGSRCRCHRRAARMPTAQSGPSRRRSARWPRSRPGPRPRPQRRRGRRRE